MLWHIYLFVEMSLGISNWLNVTLSFGHCLCLFVSRLVFCTLRVQCRGLVYIQPGRQMNGNYMQAIRFLLLFSENVSDRWNDVTDRRA